MSRSGTRWLARELPRLVECGVIEERVAERLRVHYRDEPGTPGTLAVTILGVAGAMLVAGGIILLLAHNWDDLSRALRTALAFAPLLAAQAVAVWVRVRRAESRAWREGTASFLTLAIGGCIALVSQVHQIPLVLSELLLTWTALVLPVLYLLESRVSLTLYWVGLTAWLFSGHAEVVGLDDLVTYWVLAGLSAPALLGFGKARDAAPRLGLPAWMVSLCLTAATLRMLWGATGVVWAVVLAGLFGALHGTGSLLPSDDRMWRPALRGIGALGTVIGLLILSYRDPWHAMMESAQRDGDRALPTALAALALGLGLVAVAVPAGLRLARAGRRHEGALTLAVVALAVGLALGLVDPSGTASMLTMNLCGVGLGLLACVEGLRRRRLGTANFGLLVTSGVLVARFFDTDWSFVLLGLAFLAVNLGLLARRREATT